MKLIDSLFPGHPSRRWASRRRGRRIGIEQLEERRLLSVVSLTPTKDNTLFETVWNGKQVSSGAGTSISLGRDHFDGLNMRGLMAFDVAGNVPAGSTINSVTLTVWVNSTFANTSPSVELHKLLADWGQAGSAPTGFMPPFGNAQTGDATWDDAFYPATAWAKAGGDFSPTVSGTKVLGGTGSYTYSSTAQMVADVQAWLNSSSSNFGWLLKGDETQESGKMIDSRESSNASHRPTLKIDFTAPAAAPNMTVGDVTIAEGNAGTTNAQFTVTLSAATASTVTVNYATADGTATAGQDYTATSGTLTFAPNETTKTISVPIRGDATVEANETFTVSLSGAQNATITDTLGAGNITNDDSATLVINDLTTAEGNTGTTNLTFTVTLNAAVDAPVSVNYATADGSASASSGDYTSGSGTLNFSGTANETKTITIQVSGDQKVELDETLFVNLANLAANGRNVTIADNQGRGTITNDDAATVSINDVTLAEGNSGTTSFTFTVTLNAAVDIPLSVSYSTSDGVATVSDSDYAAASGTLNFAGTAGETKTITVLVNGDSIGELGETFFVNLANLSAGGRNVTVADGQGLGTITNDDGPVVPALAISDVTVTEGNSGTTTAQFDVTLSAASSDAVTVDYATANASAVAGQDFQSTSGRLTFAPGEMSMTIAVLVNGDAVVELTETFTVNLSGAQNARIADAQGTGTITNDDAARISINDLALDEGNAATTSFTFTVTLDAAVDVPLGVGFSTANGSATTADGDYTAASGTLNFLGSAGETKTVTVLVNGDQKAELNESFQVNLSNLSAAGRNVSIADSQGIGTIRNDDLPTVSISDMTRAEGNAGTSVAHLSVSLSGPSDKTVTVKFATSDGTALAGTDYQPATGTLTFAPGDLTKTFEVNIIGDQTVELDENFLATLSDPINATIADAQGQATVSNDDSASFTIGDVTAAEGNSGSTDFTFTVTLSAAVDVPVSVAVATADGTATVSDADYLANSGTLQFAGTAGETHTIEVSVNGDPTSEGTETFLVQLSNVMASGRSVTIADNQGTGTITNDDTPVSSIQLDQGVLRIVGTDQADRVKIRRAARSRIEVVASFVNGSKPQRYKLSKVSQIDIKLNGGNDSADVSGKISIPTMIDGGAGDDSLSGGGGNDVILGGAGRDQLMAGAGHNLLIGGSDSDQLFGDPRGSSKAAGSRTARRAAATSDNILIGGQSSYDASVAALDAILAEWASGQPYADRVNHITAGVGPNAAYKLERGSTLLDDLAADMLNSGSAPAWLLAFPGDQVTGRGNSNDNDETENGDESHDD